MGLVKLMCDSLVVPSKDVFALLLDQGLMSFVFIGCNVVLFVQLCLKNLGGVFTLFSPPFTFPTLLHILFPFLVPFVAKYSNIHLM